MLLPLQAQAREAIHIVGSSTVFPFVAAAAEQFGRKTDFRTPIVESTGTGGGLKMFCSGRGLNTPDMANASRRIKPAEIEDCRAHKVGDIVEIKLGYDGIVFVTSVDGPDFALSKRTLFLALAREVPKDGKLVANRYKRWNEIDKALPDIAIKVYGPPPTSGTRDAFVELVMVEGCKQFPEFAAAYPDKKIMEHQCQAVREDGVFVEAGENDNLIVQKLSNDDETLAIFGYSFLEQNAAMVKAHAVDGVEPSFANIIKGDYHVARSLYTYVKMAHVGEIAGLAEFVVEMTGDSAMGDNGYLILKGLLPLPEAEHIVNQAVARDLTPMNP